MGIVKYDAEGRHLILELHKKEKPNSELYEDLKTSGFPATVPSSYSNKKRAFRYDLSGLVSLKVRWGQAIEKEEFYTILNNLIRSMLQLFNKGVAPNFIDWDADFVFIDTQGRVYFIVYPVNIKTAESSIFNLIDLLISKAKPFSTADEQTIGYLAKHVQSVKDGSSSTEQFLTNLRAYVSDVASKINGFNDSRLKALIEGVVTLEQVSEVKEELLEIGGVVMDITNINTEVMEKTSVLTQPDFGYGGEYNSHDEPSTSDLESELEAELAKYESATTSTGYQSERVSPQGVNPTQVTPTAYVPYEQVNTVAQQTYPHQQMAHVLYEQVNPTVSPTVAPTVAPTAHPTPQPTAHQTAYNGSHGSPAYTPTSTPTPSPNVAYNGSHGLTSHGSHTVSQTPQQLVFAHPMGLSVYFPIGGSSYFIGKSSKLQNGQECIVVPNNPAVSRLHCRVDLISGGYFITDLNSTNGTKLNGLKLTPNQTYPIKVGDQLKLGRETYTITINQ